MSIISEEYVARRDAYLKTLRRLQRWPFAQLITRLWPGDNLYFPSDQTLLICQIAVPPQPYDEHDALRLVVGDLSQFHSPIKTLVDSYPIAPMGEAGELQLGIEQQFAVLIDAAIEGKVDKDAMEQLHKLHRTLWLKAPFVGVPVEIIVPPRQNVRIDVITPGETPPKGQRNQLYHGYKPKESNLEVYVRGYFSRDVA